jgi:single-stranded-DNA-specific exonuclease
MERARRWILPEPEPLPDLGSIPGPVARILVNRGIRTAEEAERFLAADERLLEDPFRLADMPAAVDRLVRAVRDGELIGIYGDADADGLTATLVLAEALTALGAHVVPYIPGRREGITAEGLVSLAEKGCRVVITADVGVSALAEADFARQAGLDLIITDHHLPPERLPAAVAVVNPRRPDQDYGFGDLAGVGVAYKLAQALATGVGRRLEADPLLELVAIGTIADVMPLVGENRYLVRQGLRALARTSRPGLRALAGFGRVDLEAASADVVAFQLAPRLNAASRLGDGLLSFRLLSTPDQAEARQLAETLERLNLERQAAVTEAVDRLWPEVEAALAAGLNLVFIQVENCPPGLLGLLASRITDAVRRPAVVVSLEGNEGRGSGRSIPEFDLYAALTRLSRYLTGFGGHRLAAGFNFRRESLPAIKAGLLELAEAELAGRDLRPAISVDLELPLAELHPGLYRWLERLGPFGHGNPEPRFLSRGVEVLRVEPLAGAANGDCYRLILGARSRGRVPSWPAVVFSVSERPESLYARPWDLVYTVQLNRRRFPPTQELNIIDLAPAETAD